MPAVQVILDQPERNTILAALRYYQSQGLGEPANRPDEIHDIATHGDQISLDDRAIEDLFVKVFLAPEL